jgi:peptidoglycan/xylan/chitin deacetylase (PgdA/CDA1 family)
VVTFACVSSRSLASRCRVTTDSIALSSKARLRSAARRATARIIESIATARSLGRLARARGLRGLVLNYHTMRSTSIRAHLDVVQGLFVVLSLDEVVERARRETAPDKLPVALTFDDGKRSHLTEIAPVLRKRQVHGTFFITSKPSATGGAHWFDLARRAKRTFDEAVAGGASSAGVDPDRREALLQQFMGFVRTYHHAGKAHLEFDFDRLKRLDAARRDEVVRQLTGHLRMDSTPVGDDEWALTPHEVAILARDGFTIGSHSATHPNLTLETTERVWHEVADSRSQIAQWIGQPVEHFCYPNGNASEATELLTRKAGYSTAWTTEPLWLRGRENPHRLPRVQMYEHDNRADIVLRLVLASLALVPNPDGTGFEYRHRAAHASGATPRPRYRRPRRPA